MTATNHIVPVQVLAAAGHGRAGAGNRDGLLQSRQSQCYAGSKAGATGRGTASHTDKASVRQNWQ